MALLSDILGSAYQGTQGLIGAQGVQGNLGVQGTTGAGGQGAVGTQGPFGAQGVQGIQGGLSPQGTQGSQGVQGLLGPQGTQGVQGGLAAQGSQGLQGGQGIQGALGAQGTIGDNGGAPYIFSTATADADPGNGTLRYNSSSFGSITQIFIDNQDNLSNNLTAWYETWDDSTTTTNRGYLVLTSAASSGTIVNIFRVTGGVTSATGYYRIPVTHVAGNSLPANNTVLSVSFCRSGDQGTQGAIGSQGAQGLQGTLGAQGTIGNTGGVPYVFTTGTGDNDPGDGNFKYNNSTIASVTQIFIDNLDNLGNTQTSWYNTWDDSTSTIKGYVVLGSAASSGITENIFAVTGAVTVATGYYKIPVSYVSGSLPTNNAVLSFNFIRNGDQGPQGAVGAQGSQGVQGGLGPQGLQGALNAQGAAGAQGLQGAQGPQGRQGAIGPQGLQGSQGQQGTQGIQGGLSPQGGVGSQGPQGAIGAQGSQGVQGGLAAQGGQGAIGSQGAIGAQGLQGVQGGLSAQGAAGAQGLQGTVGAQGGLGAQGLQGIQGTLNSQGAAGAQGILGAQGVQGTLSSQGAVGAQGTTGTAGSNPNWYGVVYGAWGDCDPQDLMDHALTSGTIAPTPTNISISVARIAYFSPPADITVNKIRFFGVGATTNVYRVAIYNGDTLARLTNELAFSTAANTWGSAGSALNLTLTANQTYFIAVSVNATGTTAGILAMNTTVAATTGQMTVLPKSFPGSLDIDSHYIRGAFAQFAVTSGALPATAATIATQAAWTGGFPAFWLDSNNA
jgi:hypothetical protein